MSLPKSLITALTNRSVLPLVGAGVSMSIQQKGEKKAFPSWKELLQSAAAKLKSENEPDKATLVETFLNLGQYQEAAKYAYEGLKNGLWHEFISEIFDPDLDSLETTSADLPIAIWSLSNQIITLNYDKILTWAYPKDSAQVSVIRNDAIANLPNIINNKKKPLVWHLHGHIDDTAKLVLTPVSYSKLYSTTDQTDIEYQAALQTLKNIIATRSLLFVGCSLDDAELIAEINNQNELFAGNTKPHFALINKENETEIKEKLKGTCISIITFEGYGAPLIDKINEMASHVVSIETDDASLIEQEDATDLQPESKIAFLSANPFGQNINYQHILKELRKLPYTIDCLPLTEKNLQNLPNYDYVIIATKVIKDRLVIEDDNACFEKIDFIDLEYGADLEDKKGVFVFTDTLVKKSKLEGINIPLLILPTIENTEFKKLSKFTFQIFNKNNIKYYEGDGQILNNERFSFPKTQSSLPNNIIKNETKLPQSIDKNILKNYVGRNEDLVSLSREISKLEEDNGFITIKGSGGLGKTTISKILAIKLAERGKFKGGLEFIDCEHLLNYEQFKFNIASVFNLEQAQYLEEHLISNYDQKSRLIIVDNFETLLHLEDKNNILKLLSFMSEYASIIVTSREFLEIDGENPYTLRQMTLDEAYELFINNLEKRKVSKKEKTLIRDDIIDRLLDKNPLAIKIITSNILATKDFYSLRDELQTDFFNISEDDLSLFDNATDINIDRKKSLYGSILYSYNMLLGNEQKAFEKLSLFPDGINLETFKKLSEHSNEQGIKKNIISDKVIKKLLNKSLIEESHSNIKLQSIIGRFAEKQLNKTKKQTEFFDSVFAYNYFIVDMLTDYLISNKIDENTKGLRIFELNQNNVLKAISYVAEYSSTIDKKVKFLELSCMLFQQISSLTNVIDTIDKNIDTFSGKSKTTVKVILEYSKYFNGEFEIAYQKLRKIVPFSELPQLRNGEPTERNTFRNAIPLYSMEGNQALLYNMVDSNKRSTVKASNGIEIGIFDSNVDELSGFSYFEYKLLTNNLVLDELNEYLSKLHKKSHLERIQISFIGAKIKPYDKEYINQLVVVNPYTSGLKFLMLAFCETEIEEVKNYYQQAIKNLKHIKYYYVEAIYLYAKFLSEHGLEEYDNLYRNGNELAKKYYYRYLNYLFDELEVPTGLEYNPKKYPLPDFDSLEEIIS
jgi:hypothetical protein